MKHLKILTLALAATIAALAAAPGRAQDAVVAAASPAAACAGEPGLTNQQRRILAHADAGFASLRRFVLRTRMIYQLDVGETAAWVDQQRAAVALCGQRIARIDPIGVTP